MTDVMALQKPSGLPTRSRAYDSAETAQVLLADVRDSRLSLGERCRSAARFAEIADRLFAAHAPQPALLDMFLDYDRVLHEEVLPAATTRGARFARWRDLTATQRRGLTGYFDREILPVLTPMAIDATRPAWRLPALAVNLAVRVERPEDGHAGFGCVSLPRYLPRAIPLSQSVAVLVEEVTAALLPTLFRGIAVLDVARFRLTRGLAGSTVARLEVDRPGGDALARAVASLFDAGTDDVVAVRSSLAMGSVWPGQWFGHFDRALLSRGLGSSSPTLSRIAAP